MWLASDGHGQMVRSHGNGVLHGCLIYAPDVQRIRSVMAHMALDHAKGMMTLEALLTGDE